MAASSLLRDGEDNTLGIGIALMIVFSGGNKKDGGDNLGFFRIFGAGQGLRLFAVSLWLFRSQSHSIF